MVEVICLRHFVELQELHYKRALVEAVDMKRYCTLKIKQATDMCLKPLMSAGDDLSELFESVFIPHLRKMYSTSCKEDFVQRLAELRSLFLSLSSSASSDLEATQKLESAAVKIQSLVRGNSVRRLQSSTSVPNLHSKDSQSPSTGDHAVSSGARRGGIVAEVALRLARAEGLVDEEMEKSAGASSAETCVARADSLSDARGPHLNEGTQNLLESCLFGMEEKVLLLVATGEVDLDALDPATGRSALSLAAAVGSVSCLKVLLGAPGVRLNLTDKDGGIALHQAGKFGHSHVIQVMEQHARQHGTDFVELCCHQNEYGYGPLHAASYNGKHKVVKLILELVKEHAKDAQAAMLDLLRLATINKNTCLHLAGACFHGAMFCLFSLFSSITVGFLATSLS